jgi:hypothetical protein
LRIRSQLGSALSSLFLLLESSLIICFNRSYSRFPKCVDHLKQNVTKVYDKVYERATGDIPANKACECVSVAYSFIAFGFATLNIKHLHLYYTDSSPTSVLLFRYSPFVRDSIRLHHPLSKSLTDNISTQPKSCNDDIP